MTCSSILIGLSLFLAVGVEPLVASVPKYLQQLEDHNSYLGRLNARFHLQSKLPSLMSTSSSGMATGLVPHSRRPRAILIGDDILAKVGAYVLGNLIVSLVAGALTFGWLLIFNVPYPLLLAILVALLDLVPIVGSTIGGIVVALVALTVSLPICLATIGFFILYRFGEDYFLVPRIIGKAVEVPALVTVVAALVGGALLGIIGALVAIPIAAALLLLLACETLFPRLDRS